jgi:hypothetical protein
LEPCTEPADAGKPTDVLAKRIQTHSDDNQSTANYPETVPYIPRGFVQVVKLRERSFLQRRIVIIRTASGDNDYSPNPTHDQYGWQYATGSQMGGRISIAGHFESISDNPDREKL